MKKACRLAGIKKILGVNSIHLEARKGTRDQARDYCMKGESRSGGPWEVGTWNVIGQGKRSDLENVLTVMLTAKTFQEVVEADPVVYVRYSRGLEKAWQITKKTSKRVPPVVILIYGPTGSGKTRHVMSQPSIFKKSGDDQWFDGYDGESTLLIDDFSGAKSRVSLSFLLQLLDRYTVNLPIKGAFTPLVAKVVYVTTNLHPRLWYDYTKRDEHYRALARRFHEVWYFAEVLKIKLVPDSFWKSWFETCDEMDVFEALEGGTRPNTPCDSEDEDVVVESF